MKFKAQQYIIKISIPSLKYIDCCETADDTALLLLVIRDISPSLLMIKISSEDVLPVILNDPVVAVTESVNCFGVSEPVFDRVKIFLVSRAAMTTRYTMQTY